LVEVRWFDHNDGPVSGLSEVHVGQELIDAHGNTRYSSVLSTNRSASI
jgi:hypothetical protein